MVPGLTAVHPRVQDDHAAVIGPCTDPMGPGTSREDPRDAPKQADEVLIARSRFHPLTHLAASRVEATNWLATSPITCTATHDTETSSDVIAVCTCFGAT